MKKLLSLFLVGFFGFVGFASADSVDGFNSDSPIYSQSFYGDYLSLGETAEYDYINEDGKYYICLSSADYPYTITYNYDSSTYNVSSSNYCFSDIFNYSDESFSFSKEINGVFYQSATPITFSSSVGGSDNSVSGLPGISDGFANGITSGVSSLTGGFANILPTLILYSLYILVIIWGWDIIRSWIKHIFVSNKPRIDDVVNCSLKFDNEGNPIHQIEMNGKEYVYLEGFDRYFDKEYLKYVNENLDVDYKAFAKDHYDEFWHINTAVSPYYRGGEYDENTAYRDFMYFEYQAGIDYDSAVDNWKSDEKKGIDLMGRVDRAYYDYKYSRD